MKMTDEINENGNWSKPVEVINAELQKRIKLAPTNLFTQIISTKTRDLRKFQIRDKIA